MNIQKANAQWNRVNAYFYGDHEVEVGHFHIHHNPYEKPESAYSIWSVEIYPQYRGLGHGREMMKLALAEAKALGAPRVHLYCKRDNFKAIQLYQSLGFHITAAFGNRGDIRMEVNL